MPLTRTFEPENKPWKVTFFKELGHIQVSWSLGDCLPRNAMRSGVPGLTGCLGGLET